MPYPMVSNFIILLKKIRKVEGSTVFVASYFWAILLGGLLLWLPFSNPGMKVSFLDAVFTASSALCVTGLAVVDTGTSFSLIGQIILLVLIQSGGLGITTFSVSALKADFFFNPPSAPAPRMNCGACSV
jgi:trk system potassium uptake protein TrkH